MRPFHLFCINLSGPFRSNYVFELIRGDGHWASATFSSSFAIKCADRTHSRMVPSYKLECEGRACTNNKMAADCSPTSIPPCVPNHSPVSLSCSSTYLPANLRPTTPALFCRSAYLVNSFRMSDRLKYWRA